MNRQSRLAEHLAEIPGMVLAVIQIRLIHAIIQTDRQSVQIAPGETTIGQETFVHDQVLGNTLLKFRVSESNKTANIHNGILFGAHRAAIRIREHLVYDVAHAAIFIFWVSNLDKPCILCEAAGIHEERYPVFMINLRGFADVLHRNRLPCG